MLGATSTVVDEAPVDKSHRGTLALMVAFLAGSAAFYRRGPMHALLVVALRLGRPRGADARVDGLVGGPSFQTEGEILWDDAWPEAWQDGQVVVFELPNETFAMGGLEPRPSALGHGGSFDELGLSLDTEDQPWARRSSPATEPRQTDGSSK